MSTVDFHPEVFINAGNIWKNLSEKLELSKKKKWKGKLADVLKVDMPHQNCLTESCKVCFREDLPLKELRKGDEVLLVCEPCLNQYNLGEDLVRISQREYPVLYKLSEKPDDEYLKIGNSYYQFKKGWDWNLHPHAKAVYRINDRTAKHYSHPKSIYLPLGIYQHEEINDLSDASAIFGINRLAVLRMDVDNLGKIFSNAVPENHRTFSRMASISRYLNNFFKYYLNDIVEGKGIEEPLDIVPRNVKEKGRRVSVVYSGGDDLFIIGHWLDITEAASDIRRYFLKYTGNPFMTISGGIAVNEEKYPVYQYARDAEDGEKKAKKSKDAITLFGTKDFQWSDMEKISGRVKLFCRYLKTDGNYMRIDEGKLPKTFFYRVLGLSRQFIEEGILIMPKLAYLISRANLRGDSADNLRMKEVIMNSNKHEWRITELAVMWILMMMRRGGEGNA